MHAQNTAFEQSKTRGMHGLRATPDLLVTVVQTAIVHEYYQVYFNGSRLKNSYGKKDSCMDAMRLALEKDERFQGRVPTSQTLDKWIDKLVADRLRDKADADHSGDGVTKEGFLGVCTETPLRQAVDEYIDLGKRARREAGKKEKDKALDEEIAKVCYHTPSHAPTRTHMCMHCVADHREGSPFWAQVEEGGRAAEQALQALVH